MVAVADDGARVADTCGVVRLLVDIGPRRVAGETGEETLTEGAKGFGTRVEGLRH